MGMFDFFVGNLQCFKCNKISPADSSTCIQTKICIKPDLDNYKLGDRLPLDILNICGSGYECRIIPQDPTTFSLLTEWECPNCDEAFNWAIIEIKNSVITSMKAVPLDETTINSVDLVTDYTGYFRWRLIDGRFVQIPEDEG